MAKRAAERGATTVAHGWTAAANDQLRFERYPFRTLGNLNYADFYDLFGPTKRSRRGYQLGLGWDKTLILDTPRRLELSIDGTFWGDLEQLPGYQNIDSPSDELFMTLISLHYENLRGSLGRVDYEKGIEGELVGLFFFVFRGGGGAEEEAGAFLGK